MNIELPDVLSDVLDKTIQVRLESTGILMTNAESR